MSETTDKVAIRFQPQRAEIAVGRGLSVLEAAMGGKVGILHKCGGHGSCGTCKIQIDSRTELSPPSVQERRHLSDQQLDDGVRLACQCKITGPATVTVLEDPLRRVVRELLAAQQGMPTDEIVEKAPEACTDLDVCSYAESGANLNGAACMEDKEETVDWV